MQQVSTDRQGMTAPPAKTQGILPGAGFGLQASQPGDTPDFLFTWAPRVVSGSQNMDWLRN